MQDYLTFAGVIALWIAVSVAAWWLNRRSHRAKRRRQRELLAGVVAKVEAAQAQFDAIRAIAPAPVTPAPETPAPDAPAPLDAEALSRRETTLLLRHVQEAGEYFDSVRALMERARRMLGVDNCPPLSEILQLRRDLWAASEIIMVDDIRSLGDAFAEEGSYERFCGEARRLLFKGAAAAEGEDDLIDLRLAVARADAEQFAARVEHEIRIAEEKERLPTPAEIIAYPVAAIRAAPGLLRAARAHVLEAAEQTRLAANALRESETLNAAILEFRRARERMPGQIAASMEKAAAYAKHGRESVKTQYEFLAKAYDLHGRYEETLRRAPELTAMGRQFIARLELARRSELLRESSQDLLDGARRLLVRSLAALIATLMRLQDALAPRDVSPAPAAAGSGAAPPVQRRAPTASSTEARETGPYRWASAREAAPRGASPALPGRIADAAPAKAQPPGPDNTAPVKSGPAKPAPYAPIQDSPSPETLNRLKSLFSPDRLKSRRPAAPTPPPTTAQPPSRPQTVAPSGSREKQKQPPQPKTKSAWPMLDQLRRAQAGGPDTEKGAGGSGEAEPIPGAKAPPPPAAAASPAAGRAAEKPAMPARREGAPSASATPAAGAPSESAAKPSRTSFWPFGRKAEPPPPPASGPSIAQIVQRLAEVELLYEAGLESEPPAKRNRAARPSLLKRLSEVSETAAPDKRGKPDAMPGRRREPALAGAEEADGNAAKAASRGGRKSRGWFSRGDA